MDLKLPSKDPKRKSGSDQDTVDARFRALLASKTRPDLFCGKEEVRTTPFFFPKRQKSESNADFSATMHPSLAQKRPPHFKIEDFERSLFVSLNKNKKLEASINDFVSQNRTLKADITAAWKLTEEIKEHNQRLQTNAEIQNELLKEAITANMRLKATVNRQRNANGEQRDRLKEAEEARQAVLEKLRAVEMEIADFEDEEELVSTHIQQERQAKIAVESRCSDLELEIAAKESILARMDRDLDRCSQRTEKLRQETLELKSRQVDVTTLHFQKLRELESLRAAKGQAQADVNHLVTKIRMLEVENDMVIQKLAEMQGEFPDDLSQSFEAVSTGP